MRIGLLLLICGVFCLSVPAVQAQGAKLAEAKEHYQKGQQLFELGKWDEAVKEFEAAYTLKDDPAFLFNMAQAFRRKGDAKRALDLYKNYLIKDPNTPQRAEVEERIIGLKKQIEESAKSPESAALPGPASVSSPPPLPPPPSEATPPAPENAPVTAPAPEPATPAMVEPSAPPPAPVVSAPVSIVETPATTPVPAGAGLRLAGLISGGVGVACLGVGAYMSYRTQDLSDRVEKGTRFNAQTDRAGKIAETLQYVFYGAGAVGVIGGGILYYAGMSSTTQVAVVPVSGGLALSTTGVF